MSTIRLCLADKVPYNILGDDSAAKLLEKLESLYMTKSLMIRLFLKEQLYKLSMKEGTFMIISIYSIKLFVICLVSKLELRMRIKLRFYCLLCCHRMSISLQPYSMEKIRLAWRRLLLHFFRMRCGRN